MIYVKEEELLRLIRQDGFVALENEPLADHYYQLLRGIFTDLKLIKTSKIQYIYLSYGKAKVLKRMGESYNRMLSDIQDLDLALREIGGSAYLNKRSKRANFV